MQPPATQQTPQEVPQQTPQEVPQQTLSAAELDPAECYAKRRRRALHLTGGLFALSLSVLAVGLACATRTTNVGVAGFYPGIILIFGAFLGLVGLHLQENRRHMLIAAIIFISLGVIAAFICAIIDGIIAGRHIDSRPVVDGSCEFYSSALGFYYQTYHTEITCPSRFKEGGCKLKIQSNTCYCCYLCDKGVYLNQYHVFTGVSDCWDVVHLHRMLWVCVVLNILAVCLGTISAALLGAYKDLPKPSPHAVPSPAPPPHILYNPTQHMNYPMQHYPTYPMMHMPQFHPEGIPASACPSDQSQGPGLPPPHPHNQPASQEEGVPEPYNITPDAPTLYGAAYGPCVKPPPYAY